MKTIITTLITAVLLSAGPSLAGELDQYYLEQFGESASSADLLKTTATVQPRRCGMPLHRGLKRDWETLDASTRKTLAKYLGKPVLSGETVVRSNGGHFNIHYATSGSDAPPLSDAGNGNGIPDWIENVADVFEAVYAREVSQMGYRQPPNIPYDVYLQQLAGRSEFGFTQSDILTGKSATSYIVVDNDFADSIYHPYNGATGLRITAAHEFHHAIQYGYNYYFDIWYAESTATWIEDEVYDSGNQLYDYLVGWYQNTANSLDTFRQLPDNTGENLPFGYGYGRWIFNRYLAEIFGNDVIRSSWETLATLSPSTSQLNKYGDIRMVPVLENLLAAPPTSSSMGSAFLGLTKRFLLNDWASHQSELGHFPTVTFTSDNTPASGNYQVSAVTLPAYSFQYLMLTPSGPPGQLTISYPNKPASYALVAIVQSGNTTNQYAGDGSGTIVIPLASPTDTVYLLICNNASGTTATPADPSQPIPPPPDATNPYTGSATIISQPTDPPPATGGGGGGSCFIATAAYGSYLHPKVMVLRKFRDTYLLTNKPGRLLVSLYYKYSPPIADMVRESDTARFLARGMLAPLIFVAEHCVLVLWACGAGIVLAGGVHINRRRARRKVNHCVTI